MLITLSTASLFIYPLASVFQLASNAGFDGVELAVNPEVDRRGARYIRRLADDSGLPVVSVHPPMLRFLSPGSKQEQYLRSVNLANELSASVITFHAPHTASFRGDQGQRWLESVLRARADCRKGLQVGIENLAWPIDRRPGPPVEPADPRLWEDFLDEHDFGLTLDTAHAAVTGLDVLALGRMARRRLVNVHLSNVIDRRLPFSVPLGQSLMVQHQLPHRGRLPLLDLLTYLGDTRYAGPITLELSPVALHFWNPWQVPALLRESVQFCRQSIARAA